MANQKIYQNGAQVLPEIDLLNTVLGDSYKNKVLGTDSAGKITVSTTDVTPETLSKVSYLDGVTSNVQDQLTVNANAITLKADASKLTDGSVTKVGTADVGANNKPMYLVGGTPTASDLTLGSACELARIESGATATETDQNAYTALKTKNLLDKKVDKNESDTDYKLAKIKLNGDLTDTPTIYAMGTAGSNGQIQRFNASTGKMEWFSIPTTMYIKEPETGDEIKAITPGPSIEGEMRYCTADDTGSPVVYHAGNFYLCTTNDTSTYGWFAMGSFVDLTAYQLKNLGTANKAVQTDASGNISASSYALGAACAKGVATSIASGGTDLPTAGAVFDALTTGVVTKVGTLPVGASNGICYLNNGVPTAGIKFTKGTADPSGGSDGDLYFQYE